MKGRKYSARRASELSDSQVSLMLYPTCFTMLYPICSHEHCYDEASASCNFSFKLRYLTYYLFLPLDNGQRGNTTFKSTVRVGFALNCIAIHHCC